MEMEAARKIYEQRLRAVLEPEHNGRIVAIEPVSGDHFLGDDLGAALDAALAKYPDRRTGVLRVGGGPVVRIGSPRVRWNA